MIIQVILGAGLLACLLYALSQGPRHSYIRLVIALVSVLGLVLVLNPDWSNRLAHAVGVGRGADLVMYCWLVISLILYVNLLSRLHNLQGQLTQLARQMALQAPIPPDTSPREARESRTP